MWPVILLVAFASPPCCVGAAALSGAAVPTLRAAFCFWLRHALYSCSFWLCSTMLVYGGFSHRCEDYCSDMWSFNVVQCKEANRVHSDPRCSWHKVAELGTARGTPGKRWRTAAVTDGLTWYLFGGHRMWHGFGTSNSVENRWSDLSTFPLGGYQQDLWTYSHSESCPAFVVLVTPQLNGCRVVRGLHQAGLVL